MSMLWAPIQHYDIRSTNFISHFKYHSMIGLLPFLFYRSPFIDV